MFYYFVELFKALVTTCMVQDWVFFSIEFLGVFGIITLYTFVLDLIGIQSLFFQDSL